MPSEVSSDTVSCHFVWLYRGNSSLVWLQHHSPYYDVAKMFTPRLDVKMVHVIFFCFTSCVSSTWWEEENRIIFRESNNTGLVHSSLKVCTTRGGVIKFVKRIPKRNYFLGHFYLRRFCTVGKMGGYSVTPFQKCSTIEQFTSKKVDHIWVAVFLGLRWY